MGGKTYYKKMPSHKINKSFFKFFLNFCLLILERREWGGKERGKHWFVVLLILVDSFMSPDWESNP